MAQTTERKLIHGGIVTSEGKPVANALVEIRDLRGLQVAQGITDNVGGFAIATPVQTGEYIVLAAKESQIKDERIVLDRPDLNITIALPASESLPPAPPHNTVSAAELSVPEKSWKHLRLAHAQFVRDNLSAAVVEINRALQADPECASAFTMRAFVRLAEKDPVAAAEDAKRAILLDPHAAESFIALAMSYNSLRKFEMAAQAAAHALALRGDSFQGRLELAKSYYAEGQLVLALRELELVHIDFPDVHLVRGNILMGLDRGAEATEEFEIFLREAPSDSRNQRIRNIIAATRTGVPATAVDNQ